MSTFDTIMNKLGNTKTKANILYILDTLETNELKDEYRKFIIDKYYKDDFKDEGLFWQKAYPEIKDIHTRISYRKHNRVIRNGPKCKGCKSTNTFYEQQRELQVMNIFQQK